jgi:methylmalonyl-CoA/ethylmalonyl-CoA epimerase
MSDTNGAVETAQAVHLAEIGQVALTVGDLARAKAFYKDVLGMSFLFDAGTMVFFQCGGVRLMLSLAENAPEDKEQPLRKETILYYKVADLKATHEALGKAGVKFLSEPHMVAKMPDHELWLAMLSDPEGNVLGLMSEVALG